MLRRITLHQLRLFAALARTMNMTRAAEELHMTPSAFSIQIKQLSETFGVALHEQVGQKTVPHRGRTGGGGGRPRHDRAARSARHGNRRTARFYARDAAGGDDHHRALFRHAADRRFLPRLSQHHLRAGSASTASRFSSACATISTISTSWAAPPDELDVAAFPVAENPLVVIAPADHPLCGEHDIAPERLAQEPFILREAGSGTRQAVERFFDERMASARRCA